jgi:hypothetical protein
MLIGLLFFFIFLTILLLIKTICNFLFVLKNLLLFITHL